MEVKEEEEEGEKEEEKWWMWQACRRSCLLSLMSKSPGNAQWRLSKNDAMVQTYRKCTHHIQLNIQSTV